MGDETLAADPARHLPPQEAHDVRRRVWTCCSTRRQRSPSGWSSPRASSLKKTLAALLAKGKIDSEDLGGRSSPTRATLGLPRLRPRQARGLPLPGDVRRRARRRPLRTSSRPWSTRLQQAAGTSDLVSGVQEGEADALRGAHRRQPAAGGGSAQGLRQGRPGHLQPAGQGHAAPAGHDRDLRPRARPGRHLSPDELADRLAVQHLQEQGPAADARSTAPGRRRSRRRSHPAKGNWLYYVTTDLKTGETKFTDSYQEFLEFKREFKGNS